MAVPAKLRADEEFVISALSREFSASWRAGEDPPDAYLRIGVDEIAVEISTLTQHVSDDRGTRPRLTDDAPAIKLADELDVALRNLVPEGQTIGLVLSSPILRFRNTKTALEKFIRAALADHQSFLNDTKVEFYGNSITIFRNNHGQAHHKRVSAIIQHRTSSPDILANAIYIFENRMADKAGKCASLATEGPVWLALLIIGLPMRTPTNPRCLQFRSLIPSPGFFSSIDSAIWMPLLSFSSNRASPRLRARSGCREPNPRSGFGPRASIPDANPCPSAGVTASASLASCVATHIPRSRSMAAASSSRQTRSKANRSF